MSAIPEGQLIGLSLSLCIRDVLLGRVVVERIERFSTGTAAKDMGQFARLCTLYSRDYWKANPHRATEIAVDFYKRGLIDQPRLRGDNPRRLHSGDGAVWIQADPASAAKPAENSGDHDVLLKIQELMDGVEWSSSTLDGIAQAMIAGGYRIRDLDDVDLEAQA